MAERQPQQTQACKVEADNMHAIHYVSRMPAVTALDVSFNIRYHQAGGLYFQVPLLGTEAP
jgi:hypothetical protein